MDKTVTANFETIDRATFAAKNVTDHFEGIKKVKVSYQKKERHNHDGIFSSYLIPFGAYGGASTPMGMSMNAGLNSGFLPVAVVLDDQQEDGYNELDHQQAKVSITAPENLIQQIESTLYSGGGLEVRIS